MDMSSLSRRLARVWAGVTAVIVTVGTVAACGGAASARSAVPAEFRALRGGTAVRTSSGFTLRIHPGTLDVTVNATGVPGHG
jgi:hypothetical protein